MLRIYNENAYYVYPSWAQFSYLWSDLPGILSDPLHSGYLDPTENWERYGFPTQIEPASYITGPVGGGIIVSGYKSGERWLPGLLLSEEATVTSPRAMYRMGNRLRVYYLEPKDEPGAHLALGRKAKLYVPAVSMEHVDADPTSVYWLVDLTSLDGIDALDQLSVLTDSLGFMLQRCEQVPKPLIEETRSWFSDASLHFIWYRVINESDSADYHLAVMLYFALHLRKTLGRKMRAMHLVGCVEGKPNTRYGWNRR